jgi:hypothetical protein
MFWNEPHFYGLSIPPKEFLPQQLPFVPPYVTALQNLPRYMPPTYTPFFTPYTAQYQVPFTPFTPYLPPTPITPMAAWNPQVHPYALNMPGYIRPFGW